MEKTVEETCKLQARFIMNVVETFKLQSGLAREKNTAEDTFKLV